MLRGRRGVKRVLKKWASTRPSLPSTQPKARAQSIASDLLTVGSGAPSLAKRSQAPGEVCPCASSPRSNDAASAKISKAGRRQPCSGSPSNCGSWSVISNHGALDPTKMCIVGLIVGSSTSAPMATWT